MPPYKQMKSLLRPDATSDRAALQTDATNDGAAAPQPDETTDHNQMKSVIGPLYTQMQPVMGPPYT